LEADLRIEAVASAEVEELVVTSVEISDLVAEATTTMTVIDIMTLGMYATVCIDPEAVHANLFGGTETCGMIVNLIDASATTAALSGERRSHGVTTPIKAQLVSNPACEAWIHIVAAYLPTHAIYQTLPQVQ
jgi:hypothetical protein